MAGWAPIPDDLSHLGNLGIDIPVPEEPLTEDSFEFLGDFGTRVAELDISDNFLLRRNDSFRASTEDISDIADPFNVSLVDQGDNPDDEEGFNFDDFNFVPTVFWLPHT